MRDPRVEPMPGDSLQKKQETRTVDSVCTRKDGKTYALVTKCVASNRMRPWTGAPNIDQWRRWAKTATIVKRAEGTE